jgi:hypothetical protein
MREDGLYRMWFTGYNESGIMKLGLYTMHPYVHVHFPK